MPLEAVIRTFNFTPAVNRWLYHSSRHTFGGLDPIEGTRVGTLLLEFSPASQPGRWYTVSVVKLFSGTAFLPFFRMPTISWMSNYFGTQPAGSQVSVRIRLKIARQYSTSAHAFTEVTNLGPDPAT